MKKKKKPARRQSQLKTLKHPLNQTDNRQIDIIKWKTVAIERPYENSPGFRSRLLAGNYVS